MIEQRAHNYGLLEAASGETRLLEAANEKRDCWRRQTVDATLGGGERETRLLEAADGRYDSWRRRTRNATAGGGRQ
jgi:hypothetical protein